MTTSLQPVTGTAQHAAWQQRVVPPVEQLAADLWSIPVPLPDSPLRYVNVYALADDREVVLVDAGWDDDEAWAALGAGLASFGATVGDVAGVLVSHLHYDHLGLARRVREASGAWVAMHEADRVVLGQADHRVPEVARSRDRDFLCSLGATTEEADRSVGSLEELTLFSQVLLPERELHHADRVVAAGRTLTAVHTPGHTPGHLCFVDDDARVLFAGDHLLPRITPNVSVHRSWGSDPLSDYLRSLDRVAGLDVDEVLPAHEWRYTGHRERAAAITAHHDARNAELVEIVGRLPGRTPWELAAELSWSRPWSQYAGRMRVAAVTETSAHLNHLVARSVLRSSGGARPTFTVA